MLVSLALLATLGMQLLGDLRPYIQLSLDNIREATGYRITIDDISWNVYEAAGIRIDNLAVYEKDAGQPLFTCRNSLVKFDVLPLLSARVVISRLVLNEPCLSIRKTEKGRIDIPALAGTLPEEGIRQLGRIPDFSLSLKKIFINSGTVRLAETASGKQEALLDDIRIQIERDKRAKTFSLVFKAHQAGAAESAVELTGVFQDPGGIAFGRISGSGDITVLSARPGMLTGVFAGGAPFAAAGTDVSGKVHFALEPGWQLLVSGALESRNIIVPVPGGKPVSFGAAELQFSGRAGSSLLILDDFTLASEFGPVKGKCSVTRLNDTTPYLELKFASGPLNAARLAGCVAGSGLFPAMADPILKKISSGTLEIRSAHVLTGLAIQDFHAGGKANADAIFSDLGVAFSDRLPPVSIPRAEIHVSDDRTLAATATVRWPDAGNHSLQVDVQNLFQQPRITTQADSELSPRAVELLVQAFAPGLAPRLSFSSGSLQVKTRVAKAERVRLTASVDLQRAGVLISGVEKPAGAPLSVLVQADLSPELDAPSMPVSFTVESGDAAEIKGKITSLDPLAGSGTYTLCDFQLSGIAIPDIAGLMDLSGLVSGSGTWQHPTAEAFPLQGSVDIDNFSLTSVESGKLLVGGSLDGAFTPEALRVHSCHAVMGETSGNFSGTISSLLPTRGRLSIVADLFDIDDFVDVIDNFIWINEQVKLRAAASPPPEIPEISTSPPNPLLATDLDMPLVLKKLNLWNWDFESGTCHWLWRNGVMDFNDIRIRGGGGPIEGTVQLDMSRLPVRTLTLAPKKSKSEFLWIVPALRKNKTITGTTDMSGYFSSTFSRKQDVGKNMEGKFHIALNNGKLQKLTALSKILELMNIRKFFTFVSSDLLSSGMPYDVITADFTVDHAVMKTENLQLIGPAMNLTATGTINMINEQLDMVIGAQVLETFGKIVGAIPLAGSIVTGQDKAITLAYFKVSGSYQDASVAPMPVKSLSGPILKIMNTLMYYPKKLFQKPPAATGSVTDK